MQSGSQHLHVHRLIGELGCSFDQIGVNGLVSHSLHDKRQKYRECGARYARADIEEEDAPQLPIPDCLNKVSLAQALAAVILRASIRVIVKPDPLR